MTNPDQAEVGKALHDLIIDLAQRCWNGPDILALTHAALRLGESDDLRDVLLAAIGSAAADSSPAGTPTVVDLAALAEAFALLRANPGPGGATATLHNPARLVRTTPGKTVRI